MKIAVTDGRLIAAEADYAINLKFSNGWEIKIESTFVLGSSGNGTLIDLDPENPESALPLQALISHAVAEATSSKDAGGLFLRFDDDTVLTIAPDDEYEAWTATGPAGEKLVCLPGGGLAVW